MKRWIGLTALGEAVRDTITEGVPEQEGVTFMEVPLAAAINTATQYWNGNTFAEKGERPHQHDFDYVHKRWEPNSAAAWESVARHRSSLLIDSDWRVTRAQETGVPVPPVWVAYRQALRDVTQQPDPFAIVWPESP